MQGLQILLCGGKVQPGFVRFAVLLVELRLFGNQFLALGFQLFQVGQFGDFLSLEIGGCRLISCQLGAVFFLILGEILGVLRLLGDLSVLEIGRNVAAPFPVFADAGFQVFDYLERFGRFCFEPADLIANSASVCTPCPDKSATDFDSCLRLNTLAQRS